MDPEQFSRLKSNTHTYKRTHRNHVNNLIIKTGNFKDRQMRKQKCGLNIGFELHSMCAKKDKYVPLPNIQSQKIQNENSGVKEVND